MPIDTTRSRRASIVLSAAYLVSAWLLAACQGTGGYSAPTPLSLDHGPALTVDALLAPARGDEEKFRLERAGDMPTALLRRAWVALANNQPEESVRLAERVLYTIGRPTPAEEAFARFLRAEARDAMGKKEDARYDRTEALRLVVDPQLRARLLARTEAAAPATTPRPLAPVILPRTAWRARAPVAYRLDPMGRIFRITVHHSALTLRDTSPRAARISLQHVQKEQMMNPAKQWGDIGYHFAIDPAGRIWKCRDLRYQGAHARGDNNRGNIGICVLGDFRRGYQTPTGGQKHALVHLISHLRTEHRISLRQVLTHKDFVNTQCPGENLQVVVEQIRRGHPVAKP